MLTDIGELERAPGHDDATFALWFLTGLSISLIGVLVATDDAAEVSGVAIVDKPQVEVPVVLIGEANDRLIFCKVSPQSNDLEQNNICKYLVDKILKY